MYIYTWSCKQRWKDWFQGWLQVLAKSQVKISHVQVLALAHLPHPALGRCLGGRKKNQMTRTASPLSLPWASQDCGAQFGAGSSTGENKEPSFLWFQACLPSSKSTWSLSTAHRPILPIRLGSPAFTAIFSATPPLYQKSNSLHQHSQKNRFRRETGVQALTLSALPSVKWG